MGGMEGEKERAMAEREVEAGRRRGADRGTEEDRENR